MKKAYESGCQGVLDGSTPCITKLRHDVDENLKKVTNRTMAYSSFFGSDFSYSDLAERYFTQFKTRFDSVFDRSYKNCDYKIAKENIFQNNHIYPYYNITVG